MKLEIKECFLSLNDIVYGDYSGIIIKQNSKIKYRTAKKLIQDSNNKEIKDHYEVSIILPLSNIIDDELLYRPVKQIDEIIYELEHAIYLTENLNLSTSFFIVESYSENTNRSLIHYIFYNFEDFFSFIKIEGDKIKWIKLILSIDKNNDKVILN